jgi:uncharacterized phage protein (TIGR01671 family)
VGYLFQDHFDDFWIHAKVGPADSLGIFNIQNVKVIPETVGQFTGLVDNNRMEIYEGDIVKITTTGLAWGKEYDWVGEVIFSRAAFVVKSKDGKKERFTMFAPDRPIEVIGSKYENPELIKS